MRKYLNVVAPIAIVIVAQPFASFLAHSAVSEIPLWSMRSFLYPALVVIALAILGGVVIHPIVKRVPKTKAVAKFPWYVRVTILATIYYGLMIFMGIARVMNIRYIP